MRSFDLTQAFPNIYVSLYVLVYRSKKDALLLGCLRKLWIFWLHDSSVSLAGFSPTLFICVLILSFANLVMKVNQINTGGVH